MGAHTSIPFLFLLLLIGHALADYFLQPTWVVRGKRRKHEPKRWPLFMLLHGSMHGIMVFIFTYSVLLGVLETAIHGLIDIGKCEGYYGDILDQLLHVLCKVCWIGLIIT